MSDTEFKPGRAKTGGRQKGTVNKATKEAKEAFAEIVNGNIDKVQQKLDMIVEPDKWLFYFLKLSEYYVPKKAAVSVSAEGKVSDLKSELEEMAKKEG